MLNEEHLHYCKRERPFPAFPISADGGMTGGGMLRWITLRVRDQQSHVKGKFALQKEEVINEKQAHVSASVWAAVLEGNAKGLTSHSDGVMDIVHHKRPPGCGSSGLKSTSAMSCRWLLDVFRLAADRHLPIFK